MKMPLGTEVNLGAGDVVLHGVPAPPERDTAPQFLAHIFCGQTAGWVKTLLGPGHIVLDRDPAPPRKGHSSPPPSFRPISILATVSHLSYC